MTGSWQDSISKSTSSIGIVCLMLLLALPTLASGESRARRGMTIDDQYHLGIPAALAVAPDGRQLAYTLDRLDRVSDGYVDELFLTDLVGSKHTRVGKPGFDVHSPKYSPDGKWLAFIGDDGEGAQLYLAKAGSPRYRKLTSLSQSVQEFDWAPDSRQFVVVLPDRDPLSPEARASAPIEITRTAIRRDGSGYVTSFHSHLYILKIDAPSTPRLLTPGNYDESSPRWSPDGKTIAFVSERVPDPDNTDNSDIFGISPDGTGLRTLAANPGPDSYPSWSHKGDRLAFIGALKESNDYQLLRLMVVPAEGGAPLDLTGKLDQWISADSLGNSSYHYQTPVWSPDDRWMLVPLDRHGANYLAKVPSDGGEVEELYSGNFMVDLVRLSSDGKTALFARNGATELWELFALPLDQKVPRQLSRWHEAATAEWELSSPLKVHAKNGAGDDVESWLYPPLGFDPAKSYPLILYIHGGPQGFDGDYFDTGLENQIFPANGMAVLRVNYRGSTSYGEKFCEALWGDWHWREYEDLIASVDAALAQHPWLDRSRMGLGGWSYGGIMTIWTVGHTDRFKVGVPERFEVDYLSCIGEDQWFRQYFKEIGNPYTEMEKYRRFSPGTYAPNIKTPLHLISDAEDGNCPLPQAKQFYQRLKYLGVPVDMVIYPGEFHSMSRASNLADRLRRLLAWYKAALLP